MSMRTLTVRAGSLLLIAAALLFPLMNLRAEPDGGQATATTMPDTSAESSTTVTITISVVPSAKATVSWGKRRLGLLKPRSVLTVQRPRDSGPLDLVIRADGYLPVQTRAYTFADSKLSVRLTPLDQKSTLLGYREELMPEGGLPEQMYDWDAGAPLNGDF